MKAALIKTLICRAGGARDYREVLTPPGVLGEGAVPDSLHNLKHASAKSYEFLSRILFVSPVRPKTPGFWFGQTWVDSTIGGRFPTPQEPRVRVGPDSHRGETTTVSNAESMDSLDSLAIWCPNE